MSKKIKVIQGSPFNDRLYADPKRVSAVYGLDGEDILDRSGTQKKKYYLYGGGDNDTLYSGILGMEAFGEEGDDTINSQVQSGNIIKGGRGDDTISIRTTSGKKLNRNFIVDGGDGDDIIDYFSSANAKAVNSNVYGGLGNDIIRISFFLNIGDQAKFHGGEEDDRIIFYDIPQTRYCEVFGDQGYDTVQFSRFNDKTKLVSTVRESPEKTILTFAAYTINGIGYTQEVVLNGFEKILFGSSELIL